MDPTNPNNDFNQQTVVQCFVYIHDSASTPEIRRSANAHLLQAEKKFIELMKTLLSIFQSPGDYDVPIRFQALVYLSNIIKRNWNNKRLLKTEKEFPQLRKLLSRTLIECLPTAEPIFTNTLYDTVKFIAKADYPHSMPEFTQFQLMLFENIQLTDQFIKHFKQLKQIYLQLADRKGAVHIKNYEESLQKIVNAVGSLSQTFLQQISKTGGSVDAKVCKFSKYCDQILLCILRISPFSLLDDESFMNIPSHLCQKLQTLLTIHSDSSDPDIRKNLQKNIKSIIYQFGCLETANPCSLAQILPTYIPTIFYVVSKPSLFQDLNTLKYSLHSMRKLIREFTYCAPEELFLNSIPSHPKSRNYLQLRKIAHQAYYNFFTEDAIEGLLNFLLTEIMNIRSKEDQEGFTFGLDTDEANSFDRSQEKELSIHVSGTLVVQALIKTNTEMMLKYIFGLVQKCIQSSWSVIDVPTQINFLSVIAILPKSCKKAHQEYLFQFPILDILAYVHQSSSAEGRDRLREKFPALITGWLDIFTNDQINQLINVLLDYVADPNIHIDLLLYSCFSLNKVVTQRSGSVDSAAILHKMFPIAIQIFANTDNPEVLWPLINLISSLITKCHFDTAMIVSSIQLNSLQSLISNESEMLVEALCEMFKNFLCVIPRNQPALAVFQLVYHFLNRNLDKIFTTFHEKIVGLWYYAIREFSIVNHECSKEYLELFQNHYKRCLSSAKKQPTLIYILEEYLLLGLIESKLDDSIQVVVDFYQEGDFIGKDVDELENEYTLPSSTTSQEDSISLKIAALSFQITLITKANLQQVNSEEMLKLILNDFCSDNPSDSRAPLNSNTNIKMISNTLQNSLLSIINRYIILHPDYFFQFIQRTYGNSLDRFYSYYFRNMNYLTSRTATKINAIAILSLLTRLPSQLSGSQLQQYLFYSFKQVLPEVDQAIRAGYMGNNAGKVDNSPVFRFSQSVLSERKEQVRKQTMFDQMDLREYLINQVGKLCEQMGGNFVQLAQMLDQADLNAKLGSFLAMIRSNPNYGPSC